MQSMYNNDTNSLRRRRKCFSFLSFNKRRDIYGNVNNESLFVSTNYVIINKYSLCVTFAFNCYLFLFFFKLND